VAPPLLPALLLTATVWTLLLAVPGFGAAGPAATLAALLAALGLVLATRRRAGAPRRCEAVLLAAAAGFLSLPAWLVLLLASGRALGLAAPPAPPPAPAGAVGALCDLALGPALEELLYRERLLPALRGALGTPAALAVSSLVFALPHREPWHVLAAAGLGLALGAAFLATRSVGACIAAHAGLNLAAWLYLRP
jgi:membrane protease YdiL (CAAX protease family)